MDIIVPPEWFLNIDIIIGGISFFVLLLFSILSIKNYRVNRDKKFLNLGAGLGSISLAQLIITSAKTIVFYNLSFIGMEVVIPTNVLGLIITISSVALFLYRAFTLFGLYIVYKTPKKVIERDSLLVLYFIAVVALLSNDIPHLFHITAFAMLLLMIAKYYEVFKGNKSRGTFILMMAFSELAINHVIFIFARQDSMTYITGSIIGLASYITLLVLIVMILEYGKKYGKKKKQNGYNL